MADVFSKEKRSWVMSRIRGKNTKPEILVRSLLHRLGYRFTVNGPNNKRLPGRPDIVLPKWGDGCLCPWVLLARPQRVSRLPPTQDPDGVVEGET